MVVLCFSKGQTFEYYEEYPVNLLQRFHQYTGKMTIIKALIRTYRMCASIL